MSYTFYPRHVSLDEDNNRASFPQLGNVIGARGSHATDFEASLTDFFPSDLLTLGVGIGTYTEGQRQADHRRGHPRGSGRTDPRR